MNSSPMGRQLIEWVFAAQRTKTISTALRMGIFAALNNRPSTTAELAERLSISEPMLALLLDACVGFALVKREGDAYFLTSDAEEFLIPNSPSYVGGVFLFFDDESSLWTGLSKMIETGTNPVRRDVAIEKRFFFDCVDGIGVVGEAQALASKVPLGTCQTLLDIGCGSGAYSLALCDAFPELRVTAIDQQWVIDLVKERLSRSSHANRITLRVTNIRQDSLGGPVDAILLSDVLYSSEKENIETLRLAYEALEPGGCLVVRAVIPDSAVSDSFVPSMLEMSRLLRSGKSIPIWATDLQSQIIASGFVDLVKVRLTEWATCWIGYRPRARAL